MRLMSLAACPLLVTALVLAGCGASPTGPGESSDGASAPLVYAPAGTRIVLANSTDGALSRTAITVSAGDGLRGAFIKTDGSAGSFYPGCWGCGAPHVIDEAIYGGLWPLEPGKSVSFLRTGPRGERARVVIRVVGTERVLTEAGAFDTYRLTGRITALGSPPFAARVDAWWAPDPGWVVKASGTDSNGRLLTSEVASVDRP